MMKLFFDYSFNLFIQHDLKFVVLVMYWYNTVISIFWMK